LAQIDSKQNLQYYAIPNVGVYEIPAESTFAGRSPAKPAVVLLEFGGKNAIYNYAFPTSLASPSSHAKNLQSKREGKPSSPAQRPALETRATDKRKRADIPPLLITDPDVL
jgi:hypothetical protein